MRRSMPGLPADAAWTRRARRRDRRLRGLGRGVFPRPRRRPARHSRPGAARAGRRRRRFGADAGRDPLRRRHHADALPADRLEQRRRHRAVVRQRRQPCRHAGARARRADGGRARCIRRRRCRPTRCSTPSTAPSIVCADGCRTSSAFARLPRPSRRARENAPRYPRSAGSDRRRHAGAGPGQHRRPVRRRAHRHRAIATASG